MPFSFFIKKNNFARVLYVYSTNLLLKSFRIFIRKQQDSDIVIILALHRLGDSVFTIPAIREIVKYHGKDVTLICFTECEIIYKSAIPDINIKKVHKTELWFNNRFANRSVRKLLKDLNPVLLYDLTCSILSASILFNCKANEIIGANGEEFKTIYSKFQQLRKVPHLIDMYLDIVEQKIPISDREEIKKFAPGKIDSDRLLFHPFAGWNSKEWGLRKFIDLVELLSSEYNCTLLVPPKKVSSEIKLYLKDKNIKIITTDSVEELVREIKNSYAFIGNDSGPAMIASMLGIPVFIIFGPTNPEYHIPFDSRSAYIQKVLKCSPQKNEKMCFTHGGMFGCPSYECMNLLQVEVVYERIKNFLIDIRKS